MRRTVRILSLILVLATLLCVAAPALAAQKVSIAPKTLWAGCEYTFGIDFNNMPENAKLVSVKSSNSKVLKATKYGSAIYDTDLTPLKVGKAKVTVTYKIGSKKDTVSATYTVKKYPNPLKRVTVDGKALDIKNNKYYYDFNKFKGTKPLVKLTLAKGWKIAWTWGFTQKKGDDSTFKEFNPKNGKAFNLPKGYEGCVFYTLKNTKGDEIQYGVRFWR